MSKPTIIYVYDALCGWCYGFSPVMTEFKNKYESDYSFRVLTGGMVKGDKVSTLEKVAPIIIDSFRNIEEKTNIRFGEEFIEKLQNSSQDLYSSEPAAMAMAHFRTLLPNKEIDFAERVQSAIYYQGKAPANWETYADCAEEFDLDREEFLKSIQSNQLHELVKKEFEVIENWGIKGFPTTLLHYGAKAYVLSRGYNSLESLEKSLDQILSQLPNS